jgi:hypothetical protein
MEQIPESLEKGVRWKKFLDSPKRLPCQKKLEMGKATDSPSEAGAATSKQTPR